MSPKIFVDTQLYIEAYPLKDHVWFNFLKNASQSEFLKSQEGFFYAVKAFPRMLSKLASMIEDSESRLLVIENLWEEHGQGNSTLFHTNTYFQYLVSLGLKGDINSISHNPWVEEWIDNVLDKEMSASQYASYLAGIEYIYARISKKITQKLKKFDLVCEQTHYQNHSVLDYAHAGELLEVAIKCQKNIDEDLMEAFKLGVAEFLYLFKDMVLLTEFEASEIAKDKIAFYYAREDAQIECNVVKKIAKDEVKVLMICSGGENPIELLKLDKIVDITALDINPNQIALAKAKIKSINKNHELSDELFISHEGKFEKIFEILANSFNTSELLGIANKEHNALEKLKHVCENIFSNKILEIVFTPEATRYSSKSFSEHFYNVFKEQISFYINDNPRYSNIGCVLSRTAPINYNVKLNPQSSIDYHEGSFESFFSIKNNKYDMIDVSNISDWMNKERTVEIVNLLYSHLNSGGYIIGRKLLGDYDWIDLINKECGLNMKIKEVKDSTSFYTQTIIAKK